MPKKTTSKSNDKPTIVTHAGPMLKDQTLQEETVKEPLLTAPVLPIETVDANKPAIEAKPEDQTTAEPAEKTSVKTTPEDQPAATPAQDDTAQVIQVKRLSLKPLAEAPAEPPSGAPPAKAKAETQPRVQPLVDKPAKPATASPAPEPETGPQTETKPQADPVPEAAPAPEQPADQETESEITSEPPETEEVADPEPVETDTSQPPSKLDVEAEAKQQAAHEAAVQKLVDSKKYFLPINAVEKRRSQHFVIAGILLSVLLLLTWADIALDAGLIEVPGIEPLTHFFSN